jgi:hypothetical protein
MTATESRHRHQVMRIGLQGDRVAFLADVQQDAGHDKVDGRGHHRHPEPDAGLRQGPRRDDPQHGRHADADRRQQDEDPFDAAGEILGFAVPELMLFVRGTRRDDQHGQGHQRGHQVDQGLHRIREQTD